MSTHFVCNLIDMKCWAATSFNSCSMINLGLQAGFNPCFSWIDVFIDIFILLMGIPDLLNSEFSLYWFHFALLKYFVFHSFCYFHSNIDLHQLNAQKSWIVCYFGFFLYHLCFELDWNFRCSVLWNYWCV